MKSALCIPTRGKLHETKGVHGLFAAGFKGQVRICDSAPDPDTERFLRQVYGRRLKYLDCKSQEFGFFDQINYLWRWDASADIIIFAHNDVYLYGNWQEEVEATFETFPDTGFVVALGVQGTTLNGGRINIMSNMLEAEVHGVRGTNGQYITHGDGFFLAFRRDALERVGGFDTRFSRFHFYDRDICLSILDAGFNGRYAPISSHHRSGVTACGPEYQNFVNAKRGVEEGGDKLDHDGNMELFNQKWVGRLPVMVDSDSGEFLEHTYPFGSTVKWR